MQVKFLFSVLFGRLFAFSFFNINRNKFLYYSDMPRCFVLLVYESVSITRTVLMLTN